MNHHPARQIFAENLRKARVKKALSQEDLAELADLHRNYVGSVERGERNVSIDNMEKLAAALGLSIVDLLKGCEIKDGELKEIGHE